jgi:hypothetical protein
MPVGADQRRAEAEPGRSEAETAEGLNADADAAVGPASETTEDHVEGWQDAEDDAEEARPETGAEESAPESVETGIVEQTEAPTAERKRRWPFGRNRGGQR